MELQSLRQMIQAGLYQVPSERVAEAIVRAIVDPLGIENERRPLVPEPPHRSRGFSSTRYRLDHSHDLYARGHVVNPHDVGASGRR